MDGRFVWLNWKRNSNLFQAKEKHISPFRYYYIQGIQKTNL